MFLLRSKTDRRHACPPSETSGPPDEDRYLSRKELATFDEVIETITLPKFDERIIQNQQEAAAIEIGDNVKQQVHAFVTSIAAMYRDNPFHAFEHASHVTQSVIKLLSRVVAPSHVAGREQEVDEDGNPILMADALHDHTYGITSDPLTQFALAFSSMIHDADHPGMCNYL